MEPEYVEIDGVTLVRSTAGAGHFRFPDGELEWLPWSLIDKGSIERDGETGTLVLATWKAKEIGYEA
jgi:hypothetical protein